MVIALRSGGNAFQALGPATTNALSAVRVLVLGMRKSPRRHRRTLSPVDKFISNTHELSEKLNPNHADDRYGSSLTAGITGI